MNEPLCYGYMRLEDDVVPRHYIVRRLKDGTVEPLAACNTFESALAAGRLLSGAAIVETLEE